LLCLPLWFDAAVWGQYEGVLCLAMTAAIVALLNGKPGLCGLATGLALCVKPQAVTLLPALLAVLAFRGLWRDFALFTTSTLIAIAILVVPMGDGAQGVWNSFAHSVGYFDAASISADNVWYIVDYIGHWLGHRADFRDTIRLVGPNTLRALGEVTLALYTLFLVTRLGKQPSKSRIVLIAALTNFGFSCCRPRCIRATYCLL
jgi:hypothetical protein